MLLFVHFHKAGGTTMMDAFSQHSHLYKLYPIGNNGNVDSFIPGRYSKSQKSTCAEKNMLFDKRYHLEYYTFIFRVRTRLLWLTGDILGLKRVSNTIDSYLFGNNYFFYSEYKTCFNLKQSVVLWDKYNRSEIIEFINYLHFDEKINIIATEFRFWKPEIYLKELKPFKYFNIFTMIRDPLKRFISYYYFIGRRYEKIMTKYKIDIYTFYLLMHPPTGDKERLMTYYKNDSRKITKLFTKAKHRLPHERIGYPNFYIRFLNGLFNKEKWSKARKININDDHLQNAIKVFETFDCIAILEIPETWKMIEKKYGVNINKNHANQRVFTSFTKTVDVSKEFETIFLNENQFDFQLYNWAVNHSKAKLTMSQT